MVNSGGPTRACQTCRKRKIKCDEARPSCGQCIKSKRDCQGYRSETDRLFRDQTEHTAIRVVGTNLPDCLRSRRPDVPFPAIQYPSGSWGSPADPQRHNHVSRVLRPPGNLRLDQSLIPRSIAISAREQACAYLFTRFAAWKSGRHSFCIYQILENEYRKTDRSSALTAVTEALAMMIFTKCPGQRKHRPEAVRAYERAIRSVSRAVSDARRVREDATLLSVILLSFAETIDGGITSNPSLEPRLSQHAGQCGTRQPQGRTITSQWRVHVTGAYMILRVRGWKDIQSTQESMLIAAFVCVQNLVRSIFTAEPLEGLDGSWASLTQLEGVSSPYRSQAKLSKVGLKIPMLRWRGGQILRKPMCTGLSLELFTLLADVRAVDLELCAWITIGRPPLNSFVAGYFLGSHAYKPAEEPAWPGPVYHHDSIQGIHAYNILRTYRIFLQLLIFNILERLIPADTLQAHPEFLACQAHLQNLVNEICATIPCALEYMSAIPLSCSPAPPKYQDFVLSDIIPEVGGNDGAAGPTANQERNICSESPPSTRRMFGEDKGPVIAAWYVTWPLYIAYNVITISEQQRAWLRGRLRYIGEVYGIDQAVEYQKEDSAHYIPGIPRLPTPFDHAPPVWEPLQ